MGRQPGHIGVGESAGRIGVGRGCLDRRGGWPDTHTPKCTTHGQMPCVSWRGAEHVCPGFSLQPAAEPLGRQQGPKHGGAPAAHTSVEGGVSGYQGRAETGTARGAPCTGTWHACRGAAQYLFWYATSFNQPLNSWDVGTVTSMAVRAPRAPGYGLLGMEGWARLPHSPGAQLTSMPCVLLRGAEYV